MILADQMLSVNTAVLLLVVFTLGSMVLTIYSLAWAVRELVRNVEKLSARDSIMKVYDRGGMQAASRLAGIAQRARQPRNIITPKNPPVPPVEKSKGHGIRIKQGL